MNEHVCVCMKFFERSAGYLQTAAFAGLWFGTEERGGEMAAGTIKSNRTERDPAGSPCPENRAASQPDAFLTLRGAAAELSLTQTLDCGQAFRWRPSTERPGWWEGAAMGRLLRMKAQGKDLLLECSREEYENCWRRYLDMDRDYAGIRQALSADPVLSEACALYPGIRVLRQDPWETLCSFIISANNNIPRIKGIIERLCTGWGEPIADGWHTFPGPRTLAELSPEELAPLRAGYRTEYLLCCARQVASGEVDLDAIGEMEDEEGYRELLKLRGVGPKVADCVLLFAYGRIRRVPMDVWMRRVCARLYPDGLPACAAPWAGIAQQFLFHYARSRRLE